MDSRFRGKTEGEDWIPAVAGMTMVVKGKEVRR